MNEKTKRVAVRFYIHGVNEKAWIFRELQVRKVEKNDVNILNFTRNCAQQMSKPAGIKKWTE